MVARALSTCCTLLLSLGVAADTWPFSTFSTGPWTPPQLEVNKTADADPGLIFIGPRGNQEAGTAALIYDNDGNLVYQGPDEVTANFRTQKLDGRDVITFWAGDMTDLGFGYGTVHILDDTYQEIYTVRLQGHFVTPDGQPRESYIDLHESHITPHNTMLVSSYNVTQYDLTPIGGQPGQYMLDSQFHEVNITTNEILYSWSALDHEADIPIDKSTQGLGEAGSQEVPWDAHHLNSIITTEQGFLVSLRHYWSAYYLRQDGSVMWQFSGKDGADFDLQDSGFSWQHDMRVFNETEDSLILNVFNNANNPAESEGGSTGMSYQLDLVNHKATNIRNVSDIADPVYSVSQGNFQWMGPETGSHTFMGYGSIAKVKEFDVAGNTVLSAQFGDPNLVASYRGFKCPWKATPFWKPVAVAKRTSEDSADVYMSWNGATEYDNWAIYAAMSPDSDMTSLLTTSERTGFETKVTISDLQTPYLQVVARQGDTPMRASEIISV